MEIRFKVEKNEYLAASDLVYTENPGRMTTYGILGVFFILDFISSLSIRAVYFWLLLVIFFVLIDILIFARINRRKAKKCFKKNKDFLQGPFLMNVSDDGLTIGRSDNSLKIKWTDVIKSYSNKKVLLIKTPDRAIHIIPRREISEDLLIEFRKGLANDLL